jgi:hemoglobin
MIAQLKIPGAGSKVTPARGPKEDDMQQRVDRRTVAKGAIAGAAAGLIPAAEAAAQATPDAVAPTAADAADAEEGEVSLFERLGGIFAIAAVVDRFSDEIITNPKLNVNPALKAWNEAEAATRLPGLKFMRTQWIAAMAGGPIEYTGLPLSEAHTEFALTADEFAEVGAEIVRALDFFQVPEREKEELVAAYNTSMQDVVSAT